MSNYAIKYQLIKETNNGEGFTQEEIQADLDAGKDIGAADALVLASIIKDNGNFSCMFASYAVQNGKQGPISDEDYFKVWCILTSQIKDSAALETWKMKIIRDAHNQVKDFVLEKRFESI
jgi:hypothetical protein